MADGLVPYESKAGAQNSEILNHETTRGENRQLNDGRDEESHNLSITSLFSEIAISFELIATNNISTTQATACKKEYHFTKSTE